MLHLFFLLQLKRIRKSFHKPAGFQRKKWKGKEGNSSTSDFRYFSLTPISTYKSVLPLSCQTVHPFTLLWTYPIIYQFQLFFPTQGWAEWRLTEKGNSLRCGKFARQKTVKMLSQKAEEENKLWHHMCSF